MWSEVETNLKGDVADDLLVTFVSHAGRVAQATGMPRWAAGVANPARGEIIVALHRPDGARSDLQTLVRHEMAHVALHRVVGGRDLPRWFHEGVAESFDNHISLARAEALGGAVFGAGAPNLERLEASFHSVDPAEVSMAYAAARDLVSHLRYRDGHGAEFRQLLSRLEKGHGFEAAFTPAFGGVGLYELVQEWQAGLPGRFIWFALLGGGGMPFFLMGPLLGWAFFRRRQVLAQAWARIEEEDARAREIFGLDPVVLHPV